MRMLVVIENSWSGLKVKLVCDINDINIVTKYRDKIKHNVNKDYLPICMQSFNNILAKAKTYKLKPGECRKIQLASGDRQFFVTEVNVYNINMDIEL